jgi:hypothetical protein
MREEVFKRERHPTIALSDKEHREKLESWKPTGYFVKFNKEPALLNDGSVGIKITEEKEKMELLAARRQQIYYHPDTEDIFENGEPIRVKISKDLVYQKPDIENMSEDQKKKYEIAKKIGENTQIIDLREKDERKPRKTTPKKPRKVYTRTDKAAVAGI